MLAKRIEKKYEYNTYLITLEYNDDKGTRLIIKDKKDNLVFAANHMDVKYDTEKELIEFAQKEIEDTIIKQVDHKILNTAIQDSIAKWQELWHRVDTEFVSKLTSELLSTCSFCDEFNLCINCPVRTKCDQISEKIIKASACFEENEPECTEEQTRRIYKDVIDMALHYLYWLEEKYIPNPKFKRGEILQSEYDGSLWSVSKVIADKQHYKLVKENGKEKVMMPFSKTHNDFISVGEKRYL